MSTKVKISRPKFEAFKRGLLMGFILGVIVTIIGGFILYKGYRFVQQENKNYQETLKKIEQREKELESKGFIVEGGIVIEYIEEGKILIVAYDEELSELLKLEKLPERLYAAGNTWINQHNFSLKYMTGDNPVFQEDTLIYYLY